MNEHIKIIRQYRENGNIIIEIMKGKNSGIEHLNLGEYPDTSLNCTLEVTDRDNKPYWVTLKNKKATNVKEANTYYSLK